MADPQVLTADSAPGIPEVLPHYRGDESLRDIAYNTTFELWKFAATPVSPSVTQQAPAAAQPQAQPQGRWGYVTAGTDPDKLDRKDKQFLQELLALKDPGYARRAAEFGPQPDGIIGYFTKKYLAAEGVTDSRGIITDPKKLQEFENQFKNTSPKSYEAAVKKYPSEHMAQAPAAATVAPGHGATPPHTLQAGFPLTEYPGAFVKYIQQLLVKKGLLANTGDVDGVAGHKTIAAAKTAGFADEKGVLTEKGFKLIPENLHTAPHAYLTSMSKEQIAELQKALVDKGLLSGGKATGQVNEETVAAAIKAGVLLPDKTLSRPGLEAFEKSSGIEGHQRCSVGPGDKITDCPDIPDFKPSISSVNPGQTVQPSPVPGNQGTARSPAKINRTEP